MHGSTAANLILIGVGDKVIDFFIQLHWINRLGPYASSDDYNIELEYCAKQGYVLKNWVEGLSGEACYRFNQNKPSGE